MNDQPSNVAVVLPALNEQASLPSTLNSLLDQSLRADRILVCDGGSEDQTVEIARQFGVDVAHCPQKGRGNQIACGVEQVDESIVVIAHADMRFPPNAIERIVAYLEKAPDCPGGCLGHRFDDAGLSFRLIEWLDSRRARRGISYGDQAQFFRKDRIAAAGGVPAQPLMEDVELSRRLLQAGEPAYLDLPVAASSRRQRRRGILRVAWSNYRLRRAYSRHGPAACETLYRRYYGEK